MKPAVRLGPYIPDPTDPNKTETIHRPATWHAILRRGVLVGSLIMLVGLQQRFEGTDQTVHAFQSNTRGVPRFHVDPAWPTIPAKWKIGDGSSVAVDAQDRVWLLHRPRTLPVEHANIAAPPVLVFDAAGNFVSAWGGAGSGYDWPQREHGIHIDYKGLVWIGGNNCSARRLPRLQPVGDDQLLKFTQAGKLVMQIGRSNQSHGNADIQNLQQPADAFVYKKTNELFVADGYGNHRVAVFDADTGAFKRMWGAFGNKPKDFYECPPPNTSPLVDEEGPQQFSIVHALRVSNDGLVYVADRTNRRVQVFTIEGKFIKQLRRPTSFASDLALSADPQQQFLYVGGETEIYVLDRKALEIVETLKGNGILGGGHQMATDRKGNIYTAQVAHGFQKLVFDGISAPSAEGAR